MEPIAIEAVREWMQRLVIGVPGARLRVEDEKKCRELVGFLSEASAILAAGRRRRTAPLHVVDAAAGKGYVGLALASMIAPTIDRPLHLTFIERDPGRAAAILSACGSLGIDAARANVVCGDVGDASAWPAEPDLVVGLHACGDATDRILETAVQRNTKWVLVAPCCVSSWLPAAQRANALAERLGLPWLAEIRRRHVEAHVLADRTLALESAGWETRAVAFTAPTVTPYNVALRARRVGQAQRMVAAREKLRRLRDPFGQ